MWQVHLKLQRVRAALIRIAQAPASRAVPLIRATRKQVSLVTVL